MNAMGKTAAGMSFLVVMCLGGSQETPHLPIMTLAPMPVAMEQMPAPFTPLVRQINLRAEIEPSMFQGTVQAVDPTDSSLTIRTDFGRTVVLFSQDCRMAEGLKVGDRVRLEPDASGAVTVKAMDRRPVGEKASSPEFSRHLAWAPSQCAGGVI